MSNSVSRAKYPIVSVFFLVAIILAVAPFATPDPLIVLALSRAKPNPSAIPSPKLLPEQVMEPPAYKLSTIPFHEGERLLYQASWNGIPVATARIEIHRKKQDPALWSAEAWIETNRFADLLFKMRDYMTEEVDRQSLFSQKMYIRQSENKRHNDFDATFDRYDGMVTLVKSNRKGKEVKRFISTNPWGPLSGAMLALSLPMTTGNRYSIDVFTGSTRYIFAFKVDGREKITTQLGTFEAYRLAPGVNYESDGKLSQSASGTVVWVSADDRRLPLRCESQAFIGKVRADLVQIGG